MPETNPPAVEVEIVPEDTIIYHLDDSEDSDEFLIFLGIMDPPEEISNPDDKTVDITDTEVLE